VEDARGYWVHEHGRDRWSYVPWDLNNALMFRYRFEPPGVPLLSIRDTEMFSVYDPGVDDLYLHRLEQNPAQRPTWSVLNTRLWDRPALRERLLQKLAWALDGPFHEAQLAPRIDALHALIAPALREDPYVDPEAAALAPAVLKQYVRERRSFLREELVRLQGHGGGPLVINEVAPGNPGYVELHARGSEDVPLEGLVLTDDLREPLGHRLPPGLVVPAGGFLRLWASGDTSRGPLHLPFTLGTQGGELGLFDGERVSRPLDVLYFGPRAAGSAYGRLPDGSENLRALAAPTPEAPNR
jgi:spore coat protein H